MSDDVSPADAQGAWTRRTPSTWTSRPGRVVIRLRPDLAPKHVERVKLLCHEHFYDGTVRSTA